ncbi:hypothetical protein CWN48_08230 [Klebsiella pneumoniae]|nr:hypothetical protein CWN48_08230 [Klebsiella pneumoniae]PLO87121.1 hypothetical protein CWN54_04330 [Klebsiella pneumoniae]
MKMPAFEWVHVQLHQQKGMISLSPPTICNSAASATCRPNSTLVTYGYSFGDEHINRVIIDMLTIPSTHIVIIAYGDPLGRIMRFVNESGRKAQISLLLGDHFGDIKNLVDFYLPKAAIDRSSIRMAELLKSRGLYRTTISNNSEDAE